MIELLEFIFASFTHFVGTLVLLIVAGASVGLAMPGPFVSIRVDGE